MAVDIAARPNPLHDLLAQIAALGEAERPRLRGLLRKVALHDVDSISRNPLRYAKGIERGRAGRGCAGLAERLPKRSQSCGWNPKLVVRRKHAEASSQVNFQSTPLRPRLGQR